MTENYRPGSYSKSRGKDADAARTYSRDYYRNMTPEQKAAKMLVQRARLDRLKEENGPAQACSAHTAEQIETILGGEKRAKRKENDLGFAPWKPSADYIKLVADIQAVLAEYSEQLPLTVRQIYYRLIGAYGYTKGPEFEGQCYNACKRARRARMIPMESIRDDTGAEQTPACWDDAEQFLGAVRSQAAGLRLDRQEGQPKRLIFWCEAAGMVPQLFRVTRNYGVPVMSSGGTDTLTKKHMLGRDNDETEILHIGDLDPAGIHIFTALAEDVSTFAESYDKELDFTRLAVTPEQVRRLRLDTSPLVPYKNMPAYPHDFTCQAEAIPPDELARIVRGAITERLDEGAYRKVLKREKALHDDLAERLA